jgi:hypothetical protein
VAHTARSSSWATRLLCVDNPMIISLKEDCIWRRPRQAWVDVFFVGVRGIRVMLNPLPARD